MELKEREYLFSLDIYMYICHLADVVARKELLYPSRPYILQHDSKLFLNERGEQWAIPSTPFIRLTSD